MRKTKIHQVVFFLLAVLPFVLLLFLILKVHIADGETNLDRSSVVESALTYLNTSLGSVVDVLPWFTSLKTILTNSGFLSSSSLSLFLYDYFNYLVLLLLLDVVFYAFTFFLTIIRSFVSKFGGDF